MNLLVAFIIFLRTITALFYGKWAFIVMLLALMKCLNQSSTFIWTVSYFFQAHRHMSLIFTKFYWLTISLALKFITNHFELISYFQQHFTQFFWFRLFLLACWTFLFFVSFPLKIANIAHHRLFTIFAINWIMSKLTANFTIKLICCLLIKIFNQFYLVDKCF